MLVLFAKGVGARGAEKDDDCATEEDDGLEAVDCVQSRAGEKGCGALVDADDGKRASPVNSLNKAGLD